MKKALAIFLVLVMLLATTACGNNTTQNTENGNESNQDASQNNSTGEEGAEFVPPENYATVLLVTINPQFRLYLDANGNVLAVEAVNKDAKKIAEQLSLEADHYTEAVKKIVNAANENDFVKSTTVIHVEIADTKGPSVDKEEVLNAISTVVNQVVPDLKLQVKVKENKPSEGETTENPNLTQCSHVYKDATCTAPRTCSECGATDGSANGHNYTDGVCGVCGDVQENYKQLDTGKWTGEQVVNGKLFDVELTFKDLFFDAGYGANIHDSSFDASFRDQLLQAYKDNKNALTVIDGVYYYVGSGDGGSITYTVNGDSIRVNCDGWINLSIIRISGNQLKIVQCSEIEGVSGVVLTWCE